jgi:hypothetical protein
MSLEIWVSVLEEEPMHDKKLMRVSTLIEKKSCSLIYMLSKKRI